MTEPSSKGSSRLRLFLALPLTEPLREALVRLQMEFREVLPSAGWVRPAGMHLTVKFIGEVGDRGRDRIIQAVGHAVAGLPAMALSVRGVGAFPDPPRPPRILWAGCAGQTKEVGQLHRSVNQALARCGWERERRPFHPHLTLARIRQPPADPAALTFLMERFRESSFGDWPAGELVLFRSDLRPDGAVYHVVQRFPLGDNQWES